MVKVTLNTGTVFEGELLELKPVDGTITVQTAEDPMVIRLSNIESAMDTERGDILLMARQHMKQIRQTSGDYHPPQDWENLMTRGKMIKYGVAAVVALTLLITAWCSFKIIPVGNVGVATIFGDVNTTEFKPGFRLCDPRSSFTMFDTRQKTQKFDAVGVPSQDQLTTSIDVSVQYRLVGTLAPQMLQETGDPKGIIDVHLIPKFRSLLREQGKGVLRAEDFFKEEVQQTLQDNLLSAIQAYIAPKGVQVDAVLLRSVRLPALIQKGIESKKEREQEAEKQVAELKRFTTEKEQLFATAEAENKAADQEVEKVKKLADAKAYEITEINKAMAQNPAYIKLEALKALIAISNDKGSKVYFLNGDSPSPLPLMHIGDTK